MSCGSLVLIDAKKLNAWYDEMTKKLFLHAEGEVQPHTYDIHFKEDIWPGGIKFSLVGRNHDIAVGPPRAYEITNSFVFSRPCKAEIIIATQDAPDGILIPIQFVSFVPPPNDGIEVSSFPKKDLEGPEIRVLDDENIHTIAGVTFKIHNSAEVDHQHGSINIEYDDNFVHLKTAGISSKDIFWGLKAMRITQNTQITLWISSGGWPGFVYRKVYNVSIEPDARVYLPVESLIEPFIAIVLSGLDYVKKTYPSATVHRVTAKPPFPEACNSPLQLSQLRLECDIGDRKLAVLSTRIWGEWLPFVVEDKKFDDVAPTQWKDPMMDALEADERMKNAGYNGPYTSMVLETPIRPFGVLQAYYIFEMVQLPGGPSNVYVGLNDKTVTTSGQVLPPASEEPDNQNGKL